MITLETYQSGQSARSPKGYSYFLPTLINKEWSWENQQINTLLEAAAIKLGELNAYARFVPNIDLFIQLHVTKEAVLSSRIEGTQTQINEALMDVSDIAEERKDDWQEVNNYIQAMKYAISELDTLPISSRLLRQTHKVLLDSVRGTNKLPGEFRKSQNWIGGNSLDDAVFIPPDYDHLGVLMSDLEQFLHNEDINVPHLIRIAIAHYQFETIHPFLDGNGRIGRLLITLLLVEKGILTQPLLYLSVFFEKNKGLYYDNLMFVRTKNNMTQWLKYFLVGVAETADNAVHTLSAILNLKEKLENQIHTDLARRSRPALKLLNALFQHPMINVNQAKVKTGLGYNSTNSLITSFVEMGILKELTGASRNRIFLFETYVDKFQS